MILNCGAVLLSYLLGSISFAVIVSRAFRLADPRSYGSGNPGATNVLRSGNKAAAATTLALDAAKGWLAVFLAQRMQLDTTTVALCAVAVFLGHLYPIFFHFRGGKGVATALGVLLAIYWWLGLYTALTWIILVAFFRYSSLAALSAALFAPLFYILLVQFDAIAVALIVISVLVFYRHRQNIINLMKGTERRMGSR